MSDPVDHPAHYGGAGNAYEAIRVIEAWGLGFHLGNCVKYVARAGLKPGADAIEDLRKAAWYLNRYIAGLEDTPELTDAEVARLDRMLRERDSELSLEPDDAGLVQDAALVISRTARPRSILDWFRVALLVRALTEYARRLRDG